MADPSQGLIPSAWGDEEYADATIVMGQKKWPVHCLVICKQSKYFEKALKGQFEASCEFLEEEVDALLKYLYTGQLELRQQQNPMRTFLAADYFQATKLRDRAAVEADKSLQQLINKTRWVNFKEKCRHVLGQYPDTLLEDIVMKVIASNPRAVMYESGAWDDLTAAYPNLADKVLHALFPNHQQVTGAKRPASAAFDSASPAALSNRSSRATAASFREFTTSFLG
ncbi:hypothetical protein DHEL01_v206529 [Diaporthe helianthi]|uniref:BTB domain-containing protein n=1 Tax=Diaporthe helianthi TaxID=158607 RepID=A0A2P5HXT7_DIAHE|nr:hypothetical protein DHEL01_v206529 [Diaporthe helianthi]